MATSRISGVALATIGVGTLFVYAGITGKSVLATIQNMIKGQSPALLANLKPVNPAAPTGTNGLPGGSQDLTNLPGSNQGPPPPPGIGSAATYQAYAFSQFPKYGWGSDQEDPLIRLWNQESGWNPAAQNPSSGAAGIPQDITGNFHGGWQGQIDWGLNYIKGRYGSPAMAWAHEVANNWY